MNQPFQSSAGSERESAPQALRQRLMNSEDGVDISSLTAALWRGKWWIAAATLVMAMIGAYYANAIATPIYRASSVVMLETREESVVDIGNVIGGLGTDTTAVNTEVEVIRSRLLLGKVVDALDLTQDPEFNPLLSTPSPLVQRKQRLMALLTGLFGGGTEQSGPATDERAETARQVQIRERAINRLLTRMSVSNIPLSLVFRITVQTEDGEKSARIADTVADLYILNQIETKFEATEQATSWLTQRVSSLQTDLEQAEQEVKDFSAQTSLVNQTNLAGMERQLKETRDRIADVEATQQQTQARLAVLRAATTPPEQARVAEDPQLGRLLPRIGETGIAADFEARWQQVVSRAELEAARAESQLTALRRSADTMAEEIRQQSADLIQLQQLTREAEASRLLYEYFLNRLKETSAQQGIQQADSRVLSGAVIPGGPSAPNKPLVIGLAAFVGLLFSAALVLFRESRQDGFRLAQDLEDATGLPVMGQIPLVPKVRRQDVLTYLAEKPTSAAAEAIRNLRTSVLLSHVDATPQLIGITSSLPGEGKTTMSMALAQNFASLGKKVLLIEGDIRRRVFNLYLDANQDRGLLSVLSGEHALEEVLVRDDRINADILIGQKSNTNAADVFTSDRFGALIAEVRAKYDVIILDTPPVLVVPDARILAQHVDALIFAVHWDSTSRTQVRDAMRMFETVNQPISGLVLNQIDPKGMKRYGYGERYGAYAAYGRRYYTN
ncbi:polysaccharide biosynthesis tyrosine autokinase [Pseudooceanicola sp. 200-1SW]|uniref:polysaccharide biosynthesis tyrosine autokinase n=1 Tax=Pseudooceanicola sp. 200-1SW TaxID=3425949 RepID=UPI003D7FA663